MALKQLDPEQVRGWTLEQKDRWWLEHVWRGDMPQLTWRSALTGMLLGGVLSLTNLYIGTRIPLAVGVGITSVILAFALYKVGARLGWASEFTILENNAMQSIATAAGYMTQPLLSSLAAYMLVTQAAIPIWHTIPWMVAIALLGVLFAFPLKRRFINDEQQPFPEGRAVGIIMDALHAGDARQGWFKARVLLWSSLAAAGVKLFQSGEILDRLKLGFLTIPEYLDGWLHRVGTWKLGGVDLRELTVRCDTDFVLMAIGGLVGLRTGIALLVGAVLNYLVLAPWAIGLGDVVGRPDEAGAMHYGFRAIAKWGLWWGVAMMTTASLLAFLAKPGLIAGAFRGLLRGRVGDSTSDALRRIELPMRVFAVGIPLVGAAVVLLAHGFFGVKLWLGVIAIPLVFVFTVIGVHATALTSIIPTGAMAKLTQLTYGVLSPGNIQTNLMTAGITAEVSANAANLLSDIKPGYMLGAKPRQQAIGHVLGILAGALVSVPVFYLVFLHAGVPAMFQQYAMPAANLWATVAELLTQGLSKLPESARWTALFGAVIGLGLESIRLLTKGRFWLSGVAVGMAVVIPFNACLSLFLGAFAFWLAQRFCQRPTSAGRRILVENQEPVCGGLIAGGSLMGIAVMLIEIFVLPPR